VAYAHSATPENINLVQSWLNASPGHEMADQVPSEIHYTDPMSGEYSWGYEVSEASKLPDPGSLKWFKLLLHINMTDTTKSDTPVRAQGSIYCPSPGPSNSSTNLGSPPGGSTISPTKDLIHEAAEKLRQLNIEPVTAVKDFLTGVRKATEKCMEGAELDNWVQENKVEYVLTVPAMWSDTAKDLMIQAAEDAGFGKHRVDFNLVSEPESAAAYALRAIQQNNLEVGI
jgi:hypothetical protein